jgi:hypothetical protein
VPKVTVDIPASLMARGWFRPQWRVTATAQPRGLVRFFKEES